MPKPIKKKVSRKVSTEDNVKNAYERARSFYEDNTKNVQLVIAIVIIVVVAVLGIFLYSRNAAIQSSDLQAEAYKTYQAAMERDDKDLYLDALEKFKQSYDVKRSPILLYYESDVYQRMGESDKAISSLNQLIQLFPSDEYVLPLGYSKLGSLYMLKGDYEKAIGIFTELEESNLPVYRDLALYQMANINKKIGNEDEAKRYNNLLIERFPGSPYASEIEAKMKAQEANEKEEGKSDEKEKIDSGNSKEK
jgi:tetratricopeptide (TPR) repeat protein